MRDFNRILKLLLVITCMLSIFGFGKIDVQAEDPDFDGNYEHYLKLCTTKGTTLSDSDKQACMLFREYTQKQADQMEEQIANLKKNISAMKADIANQGMYLSQLQTQLETLDNQIRIIKSNITNIETSIMALQKQITDREIRIETIDDGIKQRMAATQANVILNNYIRYIMGADSFVDILRRISAVNEITSYDQKQIAEMEYQKQLLEEDKAKLQDEKDQLIAQQSEYESQRSIYERLYESTQELVREMEKNEAELIEKMDAMEEDRSYLDDVINNIDTVIDELYPSSSFGKPFKRVSFYISSACYYYEATYGSFHAAVDVAIGRGTPMYAVANGIVLDARGGCPLNGYYGSTCNNGRGNYVFLIVNINNKFYCIHYYHLNEGVVNVGDKVYQGDLVGYSGNSGSSTGPHLHFAIYYLGTSEQTSYRQLIRDYQNKGIRFGLPYNINGACYVRNWAAPCYEDPEEIYGWYYGAGWYYAGN